MQQNLITWPESTQVDGINQTREHSTSFQQCLKASEGRGIYNRKLFFLLAAHIVTASFFLALPFFLFKRPTYCLNKNKCSQSDEILVNQVCTKYSTSIIDLIDHVKVEKSLTYIFQLFCNKDWIRVVYKVFPQTLSIIGFILYGAVADSKGRKVSLKISWRMYVVGIIMFSAAQSHFLKILGYILACINCLPSLFLHFILYFEHNIKKEKNRASLVLLACLSVGPLILSLTSGLFVDISDIDNQQLLGVLCALPAFILAFLDSKIYESAVCCYRFDKAKAFGILNLVAKENGKLPILIDLSKSYWHRYVYPSTSFLSLMKRSKVNAKMLVGFFFIFLVVFNIRISQISLDKYTSTEYRSLLVNIPTAIADLTLCVFLLKMKTRSCRVMNILIILLLISLLACGEASISNDANKIVRITHAVAIRYLSQLCDGLLLIWSIENFPTICRAFCVCFILIGTGFGVSLAYILREKLQIAYVVGLGCATTAIILEGYLDMNNFGVMKDTLSDGYYDENDIFYRS